MNSANYRVRRATTDDVDQLISLWQSANLPTTELDKRFTEFQVVESTDGKLLGAIGLQIAGTEGKIHSETYSDFALTDRLRPLLWERLQSVANNHGLFRLWTTEPAPFWKKDCGFVEASGDALAKIPAQFSSGRKNWLVLQLKEDRAAPNSLDAEFARFKEQEKERTEKMFEQARIFKGIAWGLAILLFIFVAISVVYLMRYKANLQR
jgi:N-acetylglutamate synthase-like GNAT family acetyltransferase